jgi:hypothetical protein
MPRGVLALVVEELVLGDDLPDGQAPSPPRMPTVSSRPGHEALDHHLVVVAGRLGEERPPRTRPASLAPPSGRRCEPCLLGLTTSGQAEVPYRPRPDRSPDAIRQSAVGTPASRKQPLGDVLVHRQPPSRGVRSRRRGRRQGLEQGAACVPSSPRPPWRARKTASASRTSGSAPSDVSRKVRSRSASSVTEGQVVPTRPRRWSVSRDSGTNPETVSTTTTSWPEARSAGTTCRAEARATSRSAEAPPVRTVIRIVGLAARGG